MVTRIRGYSLASCVTDGGVRSDGCAPTSTGHPPVRRVGRLPYEPVFVSRSLEEPLVVLGIDPGLTRCGFAAVQANGPGGAIALSLGVIKTPPSDPLPKRLAELRHEFAALMREFRPHVVAVEQVFFQNNVRTAMSVGQASGLALAEAWACGCEVVQYTPNQVKGAVAGWGAADKLQVQKMVQARLGLSGIPKPADAADAAALALCHLAMAPLRQRIQQLNAGAR